MSKVFRSNGYPPFSIPYRQRQGTHAREDGDGEEGEEEDSRQKEPMVVVPYVAGLSEDIRRVCRKFGIRTVFPVEYNSAEPTNKSEGEVA